MVVTRVLLVSVVVAGLAGPRTLAQQTLRASVDSSGVQGNDDSSIPQISADGHVVTFSSLASNLVAGDTNSAWDVFAHDLVSGITERVNVDSAGNQSVGDDPFSGFQEVSISADGQIVAFVSVASDLVAGDGNATADILVHDRTTGITERVSVDSSGGEGNGGSGSPALSADGNLVAFVSAASNLVSGDTNGRFDTFVHDRSTGITERVSVDSSGTEANLDCDLPSISSDGRFVVFVSPASNLVAGDTNRAWDVFLHDRTTGTTERVSLNSNGVQGNRDSGWFISAAAISDDGRLVAFGSVATNLVAGDTNNKWDVFVRDRAAGKTKRVSVDSSGVEGNDDSAGVGLRPISMSGDGRFVAFYSVASNLVASDLNATGDAFVHDRVSGITECVSVNIGGVPGNAISFAPAISADAETVAFGSSADDLVSGDTNSATDVFVRERCDALWNNYGAGWPGTLGIPAFTSRADPILGSTLTLDLADSLGSATPGLLFVGLARASIPSAWGGDLLVLPAFVNSISVPAAGASFTGTIANDPSLCGVAVDLQAIEGDPGATRGVSFSPGLELILGY